MTGIAIIAAVGLYTLWKRKSATPAQDKSGAPSPRDASTDGPIAIPPPEYHLDDFMVRNGPPSDLSPTAQLPTTHPISYLVSYAPNAGRKELLLLASRAQVKIASIDDIGGVRPGGGAATSIVRFDPNPGIALLASRAPAGITIQEDMIYNTTNV